MQDFDSSPRKDLRPPAHSQFSEMLEKWRGAVKDRATMTMDDVNISFPANSAARLGFEGEYVAVTGDGLLAFLLRIRSKEDGGQFELVETDRNEMLDAFISAGNCEFGKSMSGETVLANLKLMRERLFTAYCSRNPGWADTVKTFLDRLNSSSN